MASKLKDFLFQNKDSNELDSTTIVLNKESHSNSNIKANNVVNKTSTQIITPKVFSQVESIANQILNGCSVIVDLTATDIAEAKRICDFLNGVTFAINGKVEKIARLVYLFNPNN